MNKRIKNWIGLMLTAALLAAGSVSVGAYIAYDNYNYSNRDRTLIPAPDAYLPERVVYGHSLGTAGLNAPEDVFAAADGGLYVLDSGNARILELDGRATTLKRVITAQVEGTAAFAGAKGLFVTADGDIYVADTEQSRVVVLDKAGGVKRVYLAPESEILAEDFIFKPTKITVDADGTMYIVSDGTFEGIITMDAAGEFSGFIGANPVTVTPWDIFWRSIATRAQKDARVQFVPVDHTSLDIDKDGFIYCTTKTAQNGKSVKRLSPGGDDVLRDTANVPIVGDPGMYWFGIRKGMTTFMDIAQHPSGIYACLDVTRGKIFCYNNDGYQLYLFGALGVSDGAFKAPVALTYSGDRVAVLDRERGSLTLFAPTAYATLINEATALQTDLRLEEAGEKWERVLVQNEGFELAHIATGKLAMTAGDYKAAMKKFELGSNKALYSKALGEYRTEWIYRNIGWVLFVAIVLIAAFLAYSLTRKRRKKQSKGGGAA